MKDNNLFEFIEGPISPELIAGQIRDFGNSFGIGAHSMFIGQVRNDLLQGKPVKSIEYSAYEEMAVPVMQKILEEEISGYALAEVRVFHSLGEVKVGEICLFVIAVGKHRRQTIDGCAAVVERIKKDLPVWGKEHLDDDSHAWKVNK